MLKSTIRKKVQAVVLAFSILSTLLVAPVRIAKAAEVEINYAKALQLALHFYDAEKCGRGITGGRLEWRGDCHLEDEKVPLIPM